MSALYIPPKGTKLVLLEDWTFNLYHEGRNTGLFKLFGIPYTGNSDTSTEVTIPADSVIIPDRYYLRGSIGYDSITFRSIIGKKTPRFWVKLSDVNDTMPNVRLDSEPLFLLTLPTINKRYELLSSNSFGPFTYSEITSPNLRGVMRNKQPKGNYYGIKQIKFDPNFEYIDITGNKEKALDAILDTEISYEETVDKLVMYGNFTQPEAKSEVNYKSQEYYIVVNIYDTKVEERPNRNWFPLNPGQPTKQLVQTWSQPPVTVFLKTDKDYTKPEIMGILSTHQVSLQLGSHLMKETFGYNFTRTGLDVVGIVTKATGKKNYNLSDDNVIEVTIDPITELRKYIVPIYAKAVELGMPVDNCIWNRVGVRDYKAANAGIEIPEVLIL